jgi:hypothetical protein
MAGIGRETARTSLVRLQNDGWITRTAEAEGPHGAHWTIDPHHVIHKDPVQTRSQADTRPEGAGAAHRGYLLTELTHRLYASAHDAFTGNGALSLHLGNISGNLTTEKTLPQLAQLTGQTHTETLQDLHELHAWQLIQPTPSGWQQTPRNYLDAAAIARGTTGRLHTRAVTYLAERILWAWWQQEHQWMTTTGRKQRRTHVNQGALPLGPDLAMYPAYPRKSQRGDHRAARAAVTAGALQHLIPTAA